MKYVGVAVVAAMMAMGPARAMDIEDGSKDPLTLKYEREDKEKKEIERQYNEQMKRLKAQAPASTKNDPWGNMRSNTTDPNARR